ncbi:MULTISPECIES: aminomethyl-transferring glycine dehydrogenase [Rothia]|jgi:glycine dehydrogenase|uniref:aminomethyl-transferring glycine dehydrogenase n=1 Tax=Rothia TaxID=32207 RepID=UPI00066BA7DC|nr:MULTISPECIES: aminomethyl-transferring glycine dehydrogenase [Rothia]MDU2570740.1 aminomethyl-transferring glycine dehydrogenase [Rothia mucilaginosa]OFL51614.1 glycine dehydrogenase (aminomethyl-transferring) [Rothia sp. HMSC062H08]OFL76340.1 glycine dehydrogenase (aminomethyl-transferring) [Rothia sp. HMSC075F09]OFO21235.1 glycine dehydrogenase (aminomethyl-transferring) [Rothia sp. HMSC061C12]OFQ74701.1 glycine dehydrogenase (aminomethyl-transferring) [Rothia sp. HMSC068E02]
MSFIDRHLGPRSADAEQMLETLGYSSLDALMDAVVPSQIRLDGELQLPAPLSEHEAQAKIAGYAAKNKVLAQMIGAGYYDAVTPAVLRRNILENPGFYTSYTPYQAEISQGRLEALLNFQNTVMELTGLEIANSSLLDEASAVAEAAVMMHRANRKVKNGFFAIDSRCLPQVISVTRGRAEMLGIPFVITDFSEGLPEGDLYGVILAYPGNEGDIRDIEPLIKAAKERNALVTVAADLLALTLLKSPGELGADIAVGNTQRFGLPFFFGGPHAAYMAVHKGMERTMPGRLVGVSKDSAGKPAYRLALQTREQHIRREKATSNICTAQALLAIVAGAYAMYHGPEGLRAIANRLHTNAARVATALKAAGYGIAHDTFFDTVVVEAAGRADELVAKALEAGVNIRRFDENRVGISVGESHGEELLKGLVEALGGTLGEADAQYDLPAELLRTDEYMQHPIFHKYRSETEMMRYLRHLADKDLALDRTMIPLGSCTMKLNAAAEMEPISWPEFANIHPLVPEDQAEGWHELIKDLSEWLVAITGYDAISLQPNSGATGEYAGLRAIRSFHEANGDHERDTVLIPLSAHGTNAASAALAGLKVAGVATAADGSIDVDDLKAKIEKYGPKVAGIMITYPSTHGVFEEQVAEVCQLVHEAGGQVYLDGANLNAQMGFAQPGKFGGDVSHLNLHKTFSIPHGGGGPGVGPLAVREHLAKFLPGDAYRADAEGKLPNDAALPISQAFFGSAGVLPISWMYIAMTGAQGLKDSSQYAVLNANYIAKKLNDKYPVLYTGPGGLVAHECILDLRQLTDQSHVTAEDVCKRLMDFGFHAPTLAFPVPGTLMVEPTESESKEELDRFIEAMETIYDEIIEVAEGKVAVDDSVLRNAPHTVDVVSADEWDRPYSRTQAAFPVPSLRANKYFTSVGRIDGAGGDRNFVCECPPMEAFDLEA